MASMHAKRNSVSPLTTKSLLEAGYIINVERSPGRIFQDKEFEAVGATLVPAGSWVNALECHIIVGLKELPEDDYGWDRYLSHFAQGGGKLYDFEFVTDAPGRRVAAVRYYAGYAGAAIALMAWSHQLTHPVGEPLPSIPISDYESESAVVNSVKSALSSSFPNNAGQPPRVMISGALGRCGSGAADFCLAAGVPSSSILKWNISETARGGPFPEIAAADIFINDVYLATPTPPFVTRDSLSKPGRRLRVACDVSCDPNNPHKPVPINSDYSTFQRPTLPVDVSGDGPALTMISIDHLPSLVAREVSEAFSSLLLPSLKVLHRRNEEGIWLRAEKLFQEKVKELTSTTKK